MKIVILGDIGASESNMHAFCNADKDLFSKEIQSICAKGDLVLINLEKPLTDQITPLGKCPPDYAAPTKTINGIKLLNPTVATLANNHIMDQKERGLETTIHVLEENGIQYVGAGNNIREAREPVILKIQGKKIGIYACCEKEFSFATDTTPGANVFDPLETFDDIQKLKGVCDYLIVLSHSGMQGYPYPTPNQQKICRKMCDKGADLVVCQHSHIIGCEEEYKNGRIIYGQGNFLLDDVSDESWQTGLMIEITVDSDKACVQYIPIKTDNHKAILYHDAEKINKQFQERGKEIKENGKVEELFSEFSEKKLSAYLIKLSGKSMLTQKILGRLGITKQYKKIYSVAKSYRILDYFYCDSHREAIEHGLNQHIQNKEK